MNRKMMTVLVLVLGVFVLSGCGGGVVAQGRVQFTVNPDWVTGMSYSERYPSISTEGQVTITTAEVFETNYLVVPDEHLAVNRYQPDIAYGPGRHRTVPAEDVIVYSCRLITVRILAEEIKENPAACQSDFCDGTLTGMRVSDGTPFIIDLDMSLTLNLDSWQGPGTYFELGEALVRAGDYSMIVGEIIRSLRHQRDLISDQDAEETRTYSNWDVIEPRFVSAIEDADESDLFTVVLLELRRSDPPAEVEAQMAGAAATDVALQQQRENEQANLEATLAAIDAQVTQQAAELGAFEGQMAAMATAQAFDNERCASILEMRADLLAQVMESLGGEANFLAVQAAVEQVIPDDVCD